MLKLTTEFLSFSGSGSFTSDRGSSGFFSSVFGKILDCTKELYVEKKKRKNNRKYTYNLKISNSNGQ